MLIKLCVYIVSLVLSMSSVLVLIYSIKNKEKKMCKSVILISSVYIAYLIANLGVLGIFNVPYGLEILYISLLVFIGGILYIAAIVVSVKKRKRLLDNREEKKPMVVAVVLLMLPLLVTSMGVLRNIYLIDNADLIMVYYSHGNGGIGDGDYFAYAININSCSQFDLGIDIGGHDLKKHLSKNAIQIKDEKDTKGYSVTLNDDRIVVYDGSKKVCEKEFISRYSNIDFERGFYINRK